MTYSYYVYAIFVFAQGAARRLRWRNRTPRRPDSIPMDPQGISRGSATPCPLLEPGLRPGRS